MSQENVETVHRVMPAIAQSDLAGLLDLTDPQVEWQSFFAIGERGVYRGHEAMPSTCGISTRRSSGYVRKLAACSTWANW